MHPCGQERAAKSGHVDIYRERTGQENKRLPFFVRRQFLLPPPEFVFSPKAMSRDTDTDSLVAMLLVFKANGWV